jgi:hypothetical protein
VTSGSDINTPSKTGKKTDFWGSKPKIAIRPEILAAMNGAGPSQPGGTVAFSQTEEATADNVVAGKALVPQPPFDLLAIYHRAAQGIDVGGKFVLMCSTPAAHKGATDKATIYHFKVDEIATLASEALVRGQHQNVYLGLGLRRPDLKRGKLGEFLDIVAALALVVEEDADTGKLLTMPPGIEPTAIVETSHDPAQNRHFHFVYDRLVLPQEAQELQELAYRKCGGDVGNSGIVPPWRVPGTLNHPTWKKLERGRPPEPQSVHVIGGSGEPVSVEVLREALQAMPDVKPPKRQRKAKTISGDARQPAEDDRVMILARLDDEGLLIDINMEGKVGYRSTHCASVLFRLFYEGLSASEALVVARGSAFARKFDERGDLVEEVERVYAKWHAEINAPRPTLPPEPLEPSEKCPLLDELGIAVDCAPHVEPRFEPDEEEEARAPPPPKDDEDVFAEPQSRAFGPVDREEAIRIRKYMNGKYAVIKSYLGKTLVMHAMTDEKGRPQEYWYTIHDFHKGAASNEGWIEVHNSNAATPGKTKFIPVTEWWIKHKKRKEYKTVVFDPSTDSRNINGHYNLWSGFGVKPEPGSWVLMRAHLFEVLCNGDKNFFEYAVKWLAWCVQNPEKQAEVGLVFRGDKGTGKGVLGEAMIRIFGFRHSLHLSNPTQLAGRFTGHFEQCVFVFADESIWAGSRLEEQQLKALVTNPTYALEKKFKDAKLAENRLKFLMGSNSDWVVPSSEGHERRWAVQDVNKKYIGNRTYFNALHEELYKCGGIEAMLSSLLHLDLEGWHPRNGVPDTAALRDQAMLSLSSVEKWLYGLLWEGKLSHPFLSDGSRIRTGDLVISAQENIGNVRGKPIQLADLKPFFEKWNIKHHRNEKGRFWQFPKLEDIRVAWDYRFGKQEWSKPLEWVSRNDWVGQD